MKPRNIVLAATAAFVILAVQLAWWAGTPGDRPISSGRSRPSAPVVTQTGEVIPAANLSGGTDTPSPGTSPAAKAASLHGHGALVSTQRAGATPADQAAAWMGSPAREAALVEANKVRHMISDYHTLMGENPVGTNAEIMKAVVGGNARQAVLGPPDGQTLNDKGELVDQWGTPYFFHQMSANRMDIYSAGPDKIMGTADDIVIK
jgi:hypothetical protein